MANRLAPLFGGVLSLATLGLALASPQKSSVSRQVPSIRFNRDIRPLLSDNCFACHGPDKNKRVGDLRLDQPNRAVVAGDPLASALVQRILKPSGDVLQMPPTYSHKSLSEAQKSLLIRWIAEGAHYEPHWSFAPIVSPPVPKVPGVRNAIDAFIGARLTREGLSLSLEAPKTTLLRRLSLDLTGLPPTPKELDAFLADTSATAYERQVDRLLASPHYGERMAVPWLDLVRYADTVGYHGDQNMNAWAYRDWVIDAFNQNMPFDRFTVEQVAGDLLPNASPAQKTATCFNRLNMVTREGGAQPKEYLAKYATDRVRTVGMAWLGLTTGCAECHDHKYDPFTQRDFYSLAAYFGDVKQWGVYADYGYTPNPELRGVGNDHPFPPEITVESAYLKAQLNRRMASREALAREIAVPSAWLETTKAFLQAHPDGWEPLSPSTNQLSIGSIRLELLPGKKPLPSSVTPALKIIGVDGKSRAVTIRYAAASQFEPSYRDGAALLGVHRGWNLPSAKSDTPFVAIYLPETPIVLKAGETLRVEVPKTEPEQVRVSVSPLVPENPDTLLLPTTLAHPQLAYLLATASYPALFAQAKSIEAEIVGLRQGRTPVMVTESVKSPLVFRILPRGNWQNESGPITPPATPAFLPKQARGGRRELAEWLVSRENPLTARVFVNRLWKLLFGNGLSASVEDLGAQGEPPTHPELLDWLAADFQRDWNVKRAVKQLVLSQTYRQSAVLRPELRDKDPQNRLLASQNPRRLEAEFVRDNALAIAGLLNPERGGPPAKPYQPAGYYAPLQFPDRDYIADRNESQWRRGVYMHWQRTFLHPMLANFDAPNRDEPSCTRTQANTPQQALTLLNDPQFVEAARVLATQLSGATDTQKLDTLFRRAVARTPKPAERASLLAFLTKVRTAYKERPDDAKKLLSMGNAPKSTQNETIELAAWTSVCRVVLNLHETITRY